MMTNKIILGTVQLGLDYGVNNTSGKPDKKIVEAIFESAFKAGIQILDTAEAYGNSQELIGEYHRGSGNRFKVVTKFSERREDLPVNIEERVLANLKTLHIDSLYGYLFHSFKDFEKHYLPNKEIIHRLKNSGVIQKIGVSIYTNEEFERVLSYEGIDLVQLPFNVLDNVNQREEVILKAKAKGIEIHVRSVFLQGLFFKKPDELPVKLKRLAPYIHNLHSISNKHHLKFNELTLNYVVQQECIDYILFGAETLDQLNENIQILKNKLSPDVISQINAIDVKEKELLNPLNWWKMNVLAITQARMGSTRLPGKVLKEINGKSFLEIHLERVLKSTKIDSLVVATTINKEDEAIVDVANKFNLPFYRGSSSDVLDRFYQAAIKYSPKWVVRVTSDCPLIDAEIIDAVIDKAIAEDLDYCSNSLETTFPNGMDVEVFKMSALLKARENATLNSDKEHVTPYIYKNSNFFGQNMFVSGNYSSNENYGNVRLTIDEPADVEVLRLVIESLGIEKDWKTYADFYLSNGEIQKINGHIARNEGYAKSLKNDENNDN